LATFALIIAGALVTSNSASLALANWPTFGRNEQVVLSGAAWQYAHRLIALLVGTLTLILAIWTWRTDRRFWMKQLAMTALGVVILQAFLGGLAVLRSLPPVISTAHAVLGQTSFCLAIAIVLFTGRRFVRQEPRAARDSRKPSLITLTNLSVLVVYVQVVLGGLFRHNASNWEPHVFGAAAVTFILIWTAVRVLSYYSELEDLRRPAILVLSLVIVELCFGFLSFLTKVVWGLQGTQAGTLMISSTVSHTAVGALLLASTVVLAIQSRRHLAILDRQTVVTTAPRHVVA